VLPDTTVPSLTLRLREWLRTLVAFAVTVAVGTLGASLHRQSRVHPDFRFLAWGAVVAMLVVGGFTVRWFAQSLGRLVTQGSVVSAGAVVRLVTTGVGYLVVLFFSFAVLGVSLERLLIGAGVAGVVLGIAAQQSLANVFAAVVLILARPFKVGERVVIRSAAFGLLNAEVLAIGLTYVVVRTDTGTLRIPNSAMLASAIGRETPSTDPEA